MPADRRIIALLLVVLLIGATLIGVLVTANRRGPHQPPAAATRAAQVSARTASPAAAVTPAPHVDQPAIVGTVSGDDWHLLSPIQPEPHSGLYGYEPNSLIPGASLEMSWAELQTGPNRFDWSRLDAALELGPVILRLKCGTPQDIPGFIVKRHPEWKTFMNIERIVELPQWSPGWLDEWRPFITALGAHAKDNPRLWGLQLQFTADGEPGTKPVDVARFERLGLSPATLQDFLSNYYRISLDAFPGDEWKLFSVWKPDFIEGEYAGPFSKSAYAQAAIDGSAEAFQRGLGIRGSGVAEDYETAPNWPAWGAITDGQLVIADATFPPILNHSHIDGQLENYYGSNKSSRVTTSDEPTLRYAMRMSLLRALASEYSFLWLDGDDAEFVGADLVRWARLELGRQPSEAADAWLVLGQFKTIQAMPRWVRPLNLAATQPGPTIDTAGLDFVDNAQELGRGFTDLQLDIDDRFLPPGGPDEVQVVVTYLDTGASFHLEYDAVGGPKVAPTVGRTGTGTGAGAGASSGGWVSVTIQLPDAAFAGRLAGGADLRLVAESGTPVVQIVRVIRQR